MTASGDVSAVQDGATTSAFTYDFRDRLIAFAPGYPAGSDLIDAYVGFTDRLKASGTFSGSTLVSGYAFDYDYQTNVSSLGLVANGSVTTAMCFRHDPLGRIAIVGTGTNGGGDSISCVRDSDVAQVTSRYGYDARNRRVARWLASTGDWTYFVFDQSGELLSELRQSGGAWVPIRDYIWLEGRPLAQIEYASGGQPRPYFIHADHLGMPRRLTNAQGAVVWSAATQPYGEITETTWPDPSTGQRVVTNLRLPGQYDERLFAAAGLTGLQGPYYNWNRWYLPGVGRYLELDPLAMRGEFNEEFGPEWYVYAAGNPLSNTDFSGLYTEEHYMCMTSCLGSGSCCIGGGAGICKYLGPTLGLAAGCYGDVVGACVGATLVCTAKCNKDERKRCKANPNTLGCGTKEPRPNPNR
jgi:RHS repeat-associated protein